MMCEGIIRSEQDIHGHCVQMTSFIGTLKRKKRKNMNETQI